MSSRPPGVLYQVRDEALDQQWVAGGSGGFERRAVPQCDRGMRSQDFGGSGGQIDGLPAQMSVLGPGEGEQRLE
jgi:hypothetical protein